VAGFGIKKKNSSQQHLQVRKGGSAPALFLAQGSRAGAEQPFLTCNFIYLVHNISACFNIKKKKFKSTTFAGQEG